MRKVIFLFLLSLSLGDTFAQLNESDTLKFGYKFTTTGLIQSGNVRQVVLSSGLDILHYSPVISLRSINSNVYQTFYGVKTDENFISKNFVYYAYQNSVYPYIMTWLETNYRRKIGFRYQIGPGISFRVLNTKNQLLKLSLTSTYEHSEFSKVFAFENYNKISDEINTWRVTSRLFGRTSIVENNLQLNYEFWFQQSIQDANNYRFHYQSNLVFSLSKKLNILAAIDGSYENIIPIGVKHDDFKFTFGISYGNIK